MNMIDIINTYKNTSKNTSNEFYFYGYRFPLTNGNTLSVIFGNGTYSRPRQYLSAIEMSRYEEVEIAILSPQGDFIRDGVMIPTDHYDDVNVVDIATLSKFLAENGSR